MKSEVIYRILRAQIEGGKFAIGSQLPSETKLCQEHDVARGTVRIALKQLAADGYLRAGQGRQRIVQRHEPIRLEKFRIPSTGHREPASKYPTKASQMRGSGKLTSSFGQYLSKLGFNPSDIVLVHATKLPCYQLASEPRLMHASLNDELQIRPENEVIWLLRLRSANGEPLALQWVVIPTQILSDIPLDYLVPGGLTQFYEEHGIHREEAKADYSPTIASKSEAGLLRVETGAPLIEERRVSYLAGRRKRERVPYEYLLSLYGHRVTLTFKWNDRTA